MKHQQSGFTLIELIVVIVILGILAATALPRFSGLSADARVAKLNGIVASMKDASLMAHGQYLAEQVASNANVLMGDGNAVIMYNGYPDSTTTGIVAALDPSLVADTTLNFSGGTAGPSTPGAGANSGVYVNFANFPNCQIEYDSASGVAAPLFNVVSAIPSQCQ